MKYCFWFLLYSVLFISTAFLSPVLADSDRFQCETDTRLQNAEAEELLQSVQERYARIDSFRASFSQISYMAALEVSEESSGEVLFRRPGMMKWHYLRPHEQIFVMKAETLWLYQIAENQLLIDNMQEIFMSDLPVSFMMGIGDLSESFLIKQACKNSAAYLLELEQRPVSGNEGRELSSFKLLVSHKDHFPTGALMRDIGGNSTGILFSGVEAGIPLVETDFSLEVPPGTDIQDRRR